jgi:hypothetical protein
MAGEGEDTPYGELSEQQLQEELQKRGLDAEVVASIMQNSIQCAV